jgi:hypothetical protein
MLITEDVERARRARRSKTDIEDIRAGLHEIVGSDHPMSVRQVFYQAVTRGLVEKTEQECKQGLLGIRGWRGMMDQKIESTNEIG